MMIRLAMATAMARGRGKMGEPSRRTELRTSVVAPTTGTMPAKPIRMTTWMMASQSRCEGGRVEWEESQDWMA